MGTPPMADTNSPLLIITSYPTMTTYLPDYGVVNDLSNGCMFDLYSKIGFERPRASAGVLHLDVTPFRIDRPVASAAY